MEPAKNARPSERSDVYYCIVDDFYTVEEAAKSTRTGEPQRVSTYERCLMHDSLRMHFGVFMVLTGATVV